jgi:hypothetical protein
MPAICKAHILGDPEARDHLCNVVRGFFADFPGTWKVGFLGSNTNTVWQMNVESPSGRKWSRDLVGENDEHKPEIILK